MAELGWLWHLSLTMALLGLLMAHGITSDPVHQKVLSEKVSQLMDWTTKNRVIRMSSTMFYHFVLEPPRNYAVIVLFTALHESRECIMCRRVAEEFQVLANFWQHSGASDNKVFFAVVDYDESPEIFYMVRVMSVPNILHFSATRNFIFGDFYDFNRNGILAEQMAKWVFSRTNNSIGQPTNGHDLFMLGVTVALCGGLGYLLKRKRWIIFNKTFWAPLALFFVTVMTSGQMWTRIKGAPYGQWNPHTRRVHYIKKMSHSQFAVEAYIIALFNTCISLGMVLLDKAATSRMNTVKRKILCIIGLFLMVIFFCWLLSLFSFKVSGYPYGFQMD